MAVSMMRNAGAFALAIGLALPAAAAAQDAAQVKRGQEIYGAQKCQVCHSIAGVGNKANPLDGVGAKLSADQVRRWITQPVEMTKETSSTKKPPMPARWAKMPAAELDPLVAYMMSLK
jgi:mono/diheme cytochrome c family protein